MYDWFNGTKDGNSVSMGVISNGNKYDVPDDLIFSFPLDVANGEWKVRDYELNDFQKEKLKASWEELLGERKIALDF